MRECRQLVPVACWIAVGLAVAACSGDARSPMSGSLSAQLTMVGEIDVDAVDWEITGGEMEPMTGTIDTSAPGSTASIDVFGLPWGDAYEILMEATSTDGQTSCNGSAGFDVEPGKVTELAVMLNCKRPESFGGVRINGKLNSCAELTKVVVAPLQTSVGGNIDLSAAASDAEGDAVAYEWTASEGSIDDSTVPVSVYTCTEPGEHTIRISVSDTEPCLDDWTVPVTCNDAGGGTGGNGGSGGAGGTGGTGGAGSGFPCSEEGIRAAIAVGGGPHTFACDGPTTIVTGSEIEIDNDVILEGGGELEVDGNDEHRVFAVPFDVTAELRGFRITGGATTGEGGGIHNHGALTLSDTTVSGNSAYHDYDILLGGGVTGNGGGIANRGTLTLLNCTVSENTANHGEEILKDGRATGEGGGIHSRGTLTLVDSIVTGNAASHGGGMFNRGSANLTGSTFSNNTAFIVMGLATKGGGIYISPNGSAEFDSCVIKNNSGKDRLGLVGGGLYVEGTAVLRDSTLTSNVAQLGGGLYSRGGVVTLQRSTVSGHDGQQGGGIENFGGVLILESTTVSGNAVSGMGGGILSWGGLNGLLSGALILVNSTISGNSAGNAGGGIANFRSQLILISSTVARNETGGDLHNSDPFSRAANSIIEGRCRGQEPLISEGGNVESPGNTCGFGEETDRVLATPEELALKPLSDNGGQTLTHGLGVGSVAIDRVPQDRCLDLYQVPLPSDQRGIARPQGVACDSGAVEVELLD